MKSQADVALASASRIQVLSLALRAGHPVLLAYATRLFGLASFGAFLASQGAIFVVARLAILGLDRALLVTTPRLTRDGERMPLGRAARVVLGTSLLGALCVALFLHLTVAASSLPFVLVASFSVVPVALVEVFAQATIARGRFGRATLLRDAIAPMVSIALVFLPFWPRHGGIAFAASYAITATLVALALFVPLCFDEEVDHTARTRLPKRTLRAARGSLVADFVATLAQRLDVVALALVASPAIVGAYGVIAQFSQTLRGFRTGMEPVVQRRIAEGDAAERPEGARAELHAAMRATLKLQLPIAVMFIVLREPLLAFFGVHAKDAGLALVVLTLGHVASTLLAFEVAVLHGRGRGMDVAAALLAGAVVQCALFFVLVPRFGLVGASVASALAVMVPGVCGTWRRRAHERALPAREVLS